MSETSAEGRSAWMWVGKLAPPQMQLQAVQREALLSRMEDYRHMPLLLVTSPPGFGKTTLLAQWQATLQKESIAVAWLSLDEADGDANRFLAYLLVALEGAGVDLLGLSQRAHSQSLDSDSQRTVAALVQAVGRSRTRITVMLDDYHRAANPTIDEIVLTLIERGSPWLSWVVAGRTRPHWQLSTLKARGLLHEINANDLVLSLSEASHVLGPQMDRSELAIVHSRTEGWAVALQLARLWLSRGAGSSRGLVSFSGRVSEVTDYLTEQIIENLPTDCRDFLIETSVLERFDAELADVVRGRHDSAELLARLAPYEALLVALDTTRSWFRYHMMLADFLRPRLAWERAEQIHRAAARWLARQSDWVLAVSHALKAQDTPMAIALVNQAGGWELVVRKGTLYMHSLLQQFDELSRRTEPELLLMQAYLQAKFGDEALAIELLRLAEVAVATKGTPQLVRDLKVITAMVYVYFDRLHEGNWPDSAEAANALLPLDPLAQGTVLCAGAVAALAWGRMDAALQAAQAAHTRMRLAGSQLGEAYCLIHWAQALSGKGEMEVSRQRVDEGLALAEANFGTDSSLKALVGCFKAQRLYGQGLWQEAAPWLLAGRETLEKVDGWLDVFASTAEVSWRIALREQGMQQAMTLLDQSAQLARRRSLARMGRLVQAWRVDLLAQCGLVLQAQQESLAAALDERLPVVPTAPTVMGLDWRFLEAGSLALARLSMATGASRAAQVRLEHAAAVLSTMGLSLPTWRLRLMSLLAERRANEEDPPLARVQEILTPLMEQGLVGLVLEAGPAVLPLLKQIESALSPPFSAVVTQLRGWQTHPPRRLTQFSPKEEAVLNLLLAGQANKLIARSLGVSENTVKFHLKQIFQKLGVDSRTAAIAAAVQQGYRVPGISPSDARVD